VLLLFFSGAIERDVRVRRLERNVGLLNFLNADSLWSYLARFARLNKGQMAVHKKLHYRKFWNKAATNTPHKKRTSRPHRPARAADNATIATRKVRISKLHLPISLNSAHGSTIGTIRNRREEIVQRVPGSSRRDRVPESAMARWCNTPLLEVQHAEQEALQHTEQRDVL
jgi:hypothetical protein